MKTCQNCKRCDNINHAPIGSGRRTFWCTHGRWCTYADEACTGWEPRNKEK